MNDTLEILQLCSDRLQRLDHKIDKIRLSVSEQSPAPPPPTPVPESAVVVDDIVSEIMASATGARSKVFEGNSKTKRALPRCHECHGPIRGYHQEYPHGLNICQLEHYEHCEGGISEGKNRSGHYWRGCPTDYLPPGSDDYGSGDGLDNSDQKMSPKNISSESFLDEDYRPSRETTPVSREKINTRSASNAEQLASNLEDLDLSRDSEIGLGSKKTDAKNLLGKSKEDLLLEAELAEIEVLKEREKKLELLKAARVEKQKRKENIDRLSGQGQETAQGKKKSLHDTVDRMQVKSRDVNKPQRSSIYLGPDMNEIRKDEFTRRTVNRDMDEVYELPALSNARPQLGTGRGAPVPRLKSSAKRNDDAPVHHYGDKSRNKGGDEVQPGHDQRTGEVLYKIVTSYDRFGHPHKTLEEHVVEFPKHRRTVEDEPGWQYDRKSSKGYRSPSPARRQLPSRSQYHYRQRDNSSPPHRNRDLDRTPVRSRRAATVDDRVPRMVPLESRLTEDREGKTLSLSDHAKNLPVEFAKSSSSKNMKLALWVYGAVSELHSSLIGITPPMERSVLEAKLQHMLNVVHVTCLNSNAGEYKPVSWSVGRTYHSLVQAKVDSGREHWSEFEALYRGSPHAAEMVSAEREHRVALSKVPPPGVKKDDPKVSKKRTCTTWNESDVEGKCKYEVEHPGEKCNRQHSCSYCDKKGFTRNHHQVSFCKRKGEGDK